MSTPVVPTKPLAARDLAKIGGVSISESLQARLDAWLKHPTAHRHGLNELARDGIAEVERLEAALAAAQPYVDAVRSAHNGYDPTCRAVMPTLREPATPAQALAELNEEWDALWSAEIDRVIELEQETARLREELARLQSPRPGQFTDEARRLRAELDELGHEQVGDLRIGFPARLRTFAEKAVFALEDFANAIGRLAVEGHARPVDPADVRPMDVHQDASGDIKVVWEADGDGVKYTESPMWTTRPPFDDVMLVYRAPDATDSTETVTGSSGLTTEVEHNATSGTTRKRDDSTLYFHWPRVAPDGTLLESDEYREASAADVAQWLRWRGYAVGRQPTRPSILPPKPSLDETRAALRAAKVRTRHLRRAEAAAEGCEAEFDEREQRSHGSSEKQAWGFVAEGHDFMCAHSMAFYGYPCRCPPTVAPRLEHEWGPDIGGGERVCKRCDLSSYCDGTECPVRLRATLDALRPRPVDVNDIQPGDVQSWYGDQEEIRVVADVGEGKIAFTDQQWLDEIVALDFKRVVLLYRRSWHQAPAAPADEQPPTEDQPSGEWHAFDPNDIKPGDEHSWHEDGWPDSIERAVRCVLEGGHVLYETDGISGQRWETVEALAADGVKVRRPGGWE